MGKYISSRGNEYTIEHDAPPIPTRAHDWSWVAEDYDGAPDSGDQRCGTAASRNECVMAIEEMEDDRA